MDRDEAEHNWKDDADLLGEIGRHLFDQQLRVRVRLPRPLADRARAGWERETYEGSIAADTVEQKTMRHRAGTLALIGLSIEERGVDDSGDVVVDLDAWFIGSALDAAEEAGLLKDARPPIH